MAFASEDPDPIPGYRNYLVYCDESGQSGKVYYGFGSLWLPWERRGDLTGLVSSICKRHNYEHELKWNKVDARTEPLYRELIEEFFRRNWWLTTAAVQKMIATMRWLFYVRDGTARLRRCPSKVLQHWPCRHCTVPGRVMCVGVQLRVTRCVGY